MLGHKLGFVGAGQMAKAIGFPLIQKGVIKPGNVIVSSPEDAHLDEWRDLKCETTANNEDVVNGSNVILWAVKPQMFLRALESTRVVEGKSERKFHISIMAGLSLQHFTDRLRRHFKTQGEIETARVMPNIGMRVGAGCAVYTMNHTAEAEDKLKLTNLLSPICFSTEVPESQINAYGGLFGSGIGFMFPILEAMSDGGVKMGLPRDVSLKIAAHTMKGAAELILHDAKSHPALLKDTVCSPGGTTIAGIAELERLGVRNAVISAIEAATKRGEDIGKAEETK